MNVAAVAEGCKSPPDIWLQGHHRRMACKDCMSHKDVGVECRCSDGTDSIFGLPSCSCPHNDLHRGLEFPGPLEVNICLTRVEEGLCC